jgi:hypothetical protein
VRSLLWHLTMSGKFSLMWKWPQKIDSNLESRWSSPSVLFDCEEVWSSDDLDW